MGTRTIRRTWKVDGVLTDPTSINLSDATGTYGIKRNDTDAVVVADGTAMTKLSTGLYEYSFTSIDGVAYTAWVEIVYAGNTYRFEHDFEAAAVEPDLSMAVSFSELRERIGRFAFGSRSVTDSNDLADIDACIKDGLHTVYIAHRWSFLRPVVSIVTAADDDTYDLPTGFDAIEGDMTYPAGTSEFYPPIKLVKESELRRMRQDYDEADRPTYGAIVTSTFDATVGSRRQIVFYPTPDGIYTLSAIMRMRPTMIDADNPYPLGGEVLSQVIIEACLAAAERTLRDEQAGVHKTTYDQLLAQAIQSDKEASTPEYLGFDSELSESTDDYNRATTSTITFDGETL